MDRGAREPTIIQRLGDVFGAHRGHRRHDLLVGTGRGRRRPGRDPQDLRRRRRCRLDRPGGRPGEFFTMLGPSGLGQDDDAPDHRRLRAPRRRPRSSSAASTSPAGPPYERDVNTVFQDYALFPHMSVADNVEYGLRVKGVEAPERRRARSEALELVRLDGFGDRKPVQLSGGQRQRVALARAIVNQPQVLLLDEPLGALDLKLRQEMQSELKRIQQEVGITFVYVTHDQEEALTMSDRIAVFSAGPDRPDRHPRRRLRAAGERVRRRLRRHLQPARARRPALHDPSGEDQAARRGRAAGRATTSSAARSARSSTPAWSRATWSTSTQGGEVVVVRQNLDTSPAGRAGAGRPRSPGLAPGAHVRHRNREGGGHEEGQAPCGRARRSWRSRSRSPAARQQRRTCARRRQGRGQLTMIAWEGYLDAKWVQAVRAADGLQGPGEVRRLLGRDGRR